MKFKSDKIEFNRTSNPLLNLGIIGIYSCLKEIKKDDSDDTGLLSHTEFNFVLDKDSLTIHSKSLSVLLEELYYWMGRKYYDTYTLKQEKNAEKLVDCNVYLDEASERFKAFPRISTYGLTHLLTNNAQGITRHKESSTSIKKLDKNNKELADKIRNFFTENNLKLGSKVYLNEPYTKISRLDELTDSHLKSGEMTCYLTGESYEKLVDITNISPFLSGVANFNSHLSGSDKKISWKAKYASMFAPVHAFYHYPNKLRDTIYIYLLTSPTLNGLEKILSKIDIRKSQLLLKNDDFLSNINFPESFKKDGYTEQNEVAFVLVYSIYKKAIEQLSNSDQETSMNTALFAELISGNLPRFSIDSFQAKALGNTMRPNYYEPLHQLAPLLINFNELEIKGVNFAKLFASLRILKPSEQNARNSYRLERRLRDQIAGEILNGKSILSSFERLYYDTYNYLCANEKVRFKDYDQLSLFLKLYESKHNKMDTNTQELAITLGKQIGIKIRHQDNGQSEAANARKGRSNLVSLRKARTLKQFVDELIRIDFKYGLTINEELATKINDENFYGIKQFIIIGALNILNPAISKNTNTQNS